MNEHPWFIRPHKNPVSEEVAKAFDAARQGKLNSTNVRDLSDIAFRMRGFDFAWNLMVGLYGIMFPNKK